MRLNYKRKELIKCVFTKPRGEDQVWVWLDEERGYFFFEIMRVEVKIQRDFKVEWKEIWGTFSWISSI